MARVQNTLIGKSSGSVGGATFSSWKGINVLKSKAVTVANPRTVPQVTQRNRMTLMVALFRLISGVLQIGFKTLATGKSEYNAFVAENIQDATDASSPPTVTLVPANLLTAKGTMGTVPNEGPAGTNSSADVDVTWDETLAPIGSNVSDVAYAAVYNATQDIWGINNGALRSTGTITVTMPAASASSDVLHAYLFFKSYASDEVSDSTYATASV